MNVKAFAGAAGVLWGFLLFAITGLETARGEGHTLVLLSVVYIGYSVTYIGSLIALVYGLISGAIVGGAFCWLYNHFAGSSSQTQKS
jgi:hypothetical protein